MLQLVKWIWQIAKQPIKQGVKWMANAIGQGIIGNTAHEEAKRLFEDDWEHASHYPADLYPEPVTSPLPPEDDYVNYRFPLHDIYRSPDPQPNDYQHDKDQDDDSHTFLGKLGDLLTNRSSGNNSAQYPVNHSYWQPTNYGSNDFDGFGIDSIPSYADPTESEQGFRWSTDSSDDEESSSLFGSLVSTLGSWFGSNDDDPDVVADGFYEQFEPAIDFDPYDDVDDETDYVDTDDYYWV